jgi:hypothetical protein
MPRRGSPPLEADLLQGTLDLLILKTVAIGPAHGHTIAHVIEHQSEDVLQIEHGSLYPALTGSRIAAGSCRSGAPPKQPSRPLLPADRIGPPSARSADDPLGAAGQGG